MHRAARLAQRTLLAAAFAALLLASLASAQVPDLISDRPPSTGPLPIKTGLYYIDISEIDGATETFAATAYLVLEWNDPRLKFATADSSKVRLYKPDTIWTPAVEIINAQKLDDQQPPMCTVTPDGTVYYTRRVVARLNTQMDLRRFPFDRQQLQCIVESSRFASDDLAFVPDPDQSGFGRDIVSRGWDYRPLTWKTVNQPFAQSGVSYSRLIFSFEAARSPHYFLWKIIFPTAVFVLLTWCVFWMQVHDIHTALLISITILLTAVAFGNVTDALLPKLGYRTWLDQFQLGSFLFIVAAVVETITVHGMHLGGESTRAVNLRKYFRLLYPIAYLLFCAALFLFALL
jgi:hypothetical protein